jgi:hypothetical protein
VSKIIVCQGPLSTQSSWECQMSKRKPARVATHAHNPGVARKAQRAAQARARSPKKAAHRSAGTGSTELHPRYDDSQRDHVETPEPVVENPEVLVGRTEAALRDDSDQMRDNNSTDGTRSSSAGASVWEYQSKLLEFAQANMRLSFEFAQRLATMRSPIEFPSVIAEFTSRRIATFRKHSRTRL